MVRIMESDGNSESDYALLLLITIQAYRQLKKCKSRDGKKYQHSPSV